MIFEVDDGVYENHKHPCEGCEDFIPPNGCKSRGGCMTDVEVENDGQ